jgi:site-specific recombinase XerD
VAASWALAAASLQVPHHHAPPHSLVKNFTLPPPFEKLRFYRLLLESDVTPFDPSRRLTLLRKPQRLPPPVLTKLLDSIEPGTPLGGRDRALFELMYSTSARVGEMVAMELGDVDLDERLARIRKGKGGKQRIVPVGAVTAAYLDNYLRWVRPGFCRSGGAAPRSLWLTPSGSVLCDYTVRLRLRRYLQALGIEKRLTPHGLRHVCATHLLERQADLRHIQELLGHASVATTQIYTHVSIGHLKGTLQRCHPRERGNLETKDKDDG